MQKEQQGEARAGRAGPRRGAGGGTDGTDQADPKDGAGVEAGARQDSRGGSGIKGGGSAAGGARPESRGGAQPGSGGGARLESRGSAGVAGGARLESRGGARSGPKSGARPEPKGGLGVLVGARADGDPATALELARLADRLGFTEIMIGEATGHDAFALGAALGAGPAELCLGPLPAAVRDPVTTARGAATVAALTGRPTGVALAASTSTVVEEWHGRSRADAVTVVAESAQVLRGMLAGERVDFSGVLVRTRGFESALPPSCAQLSVLAFGAELTEVAAARADRLILPIGTVEHVSRLRARVQAAAERVGRSSPPKIALWLPVAVEPDAETRRTMLRDLVPYLRSAGFSGMFSEAGFGEVVRLARSGAHVRSVVAAAPPELLAAVTAVGDVAAVRAVLGEFRAVGVDDVILVPDRPETLEALAP